MTATRLPSTLSSARRADIAAGTQAMAPWLIGVIPFGMVVGMTASTSGVSTAVGMATGVGIYSGSAQLTAIELLSGGASAIVVIVSVLVINARLILYSTSVAPHWSGTRTGFKAVAAYLLVDPSYAVGMRRYAEGEPGGHVHYLAAGVTLWIAWHGGMLAGAALGSGVPGWVSIEYVVPLFLLSEVVHAARTRPGVAAALAGASIALVGDRLPLHSGLLVGILAGVAVAVLVERRTQ